MLPNPSQRPISISLFAAAGIVLLASGAAAQLPSVISLDVPFGSEAQPTFRVFGGEIGDRLGSEGAVAMGDLNGDGFADIAYGSHWADPLGRVDSGLVVVFFGGVGLPGNQADLSDGIGVNGEIRIYANPGDKLGWSLACGDLNKDGYDDLVIGAPEADPISSASGEVIILWGDASLASGEIDFSDAPGAYGECRIYGDGFGHGLGWSVSLGDMDADGRLEVFAGAISADRAGRSNCGEGVVVPGTLLLPSAVVDFDVAVGSLGETRLVGTTTNWLLGDRTAMGDINGDGYDDLAISSIPFDSNTGIVYVVPGSPSLAGQELDFTGAVGSFGETRIQGVAAGDEFGSGLAIGDATGDGYEDLLVGAPGYDFPSRTSAGHAVFFRGGSAFPTGSVTLSSPSGTYGEMRIVGDSGPDGCGTSVGLADVNGDGLRDLLLGSTSHFDSGTVAGDISIIYGSASLGTGDRDLRFASADSVVLGDNAGDQLRWGVTGNADIDFDGMGDFAASAEFADNPDLAASNNSGCGVAILGAGSPGGVARVRRYQVPGDGPLPGSVPAQWFGPAVRATIDWPNVDTSDNGAGGASWTEVQATRDKTGITQLSGTGNPDTLNVIWRVTTDRTNWTDFQIHLRYIDDEMGGVSGLESALAIFRADALNGPWEQLATTIDEDLNIASAAANRTGYFVIANQFTLPVELTAFDLD